VPSKTMELHNYRLYSINFLAVNHYLSFCVISNGFDILLQTTIILVLSTNYCSFYTSFFLKYVNSQSDMDFAQHRCCSFDLCYGSGMKWLFDLSAMAFAFCYQVQVVLITHSLL